MKLSIITINRNNADGLENTIQSVVTQVSTDFEYIIIDGASDDGSVEIIKKYAAKITWWVSEPDSGIYNAINKGIKQAAGEYCLFLNSGDIFINNTTLQNVCAEIDGSADIYYSNWKMSDNSYREYPDNVDINYLIGHSLNHQNMLFHRSLFNAHGFYNENLFIAADLEFLLKEVWVYKTGLKHLKTNIAIYDVNGISAKNPEKREAEKKIAFRNVFNELSESIIELYLHRTGVYGDIISNYGNTTLLEFILRLYRYCIKKIRKIYLKK
jgi:glycosyltransferase involved in cell wall biosynthesis